MRQCVASGMAASATPSRPQPAGMAARSNCSAPARSRSVQQPQVAQRWRCSANPVGGEAVALPAPPHTLGIQPDATSIIGNTPLVSTCVDVPCQTYRQQGLAAATAICNSTGMYRQNLVTKMPAKSLLSGTTPAPCKSDLHIRQPSQPCSKQAPLAVHMLSCPRRYLALVCLPGRGRAALHHPRRSSAHVSPPPLTASASARTTCTPHAPVCARPCRAGPSVACHPPPRSCSCSCSCHPARPPRPTRPAP